MMIEDYKFRILMIASSLPLIISCFIFVYYNINFPFWVYLIFYVIAVVGAILGSMEARINIVVR